MGEYYDIPEAESNKREPGRVVKAVPVQSNQLPDDLENYEVVELAGEENNQEKIMREIEESAREEGLTNKPILGGEGGSAKDVMDELRAEFKESSEKAAEQRAEHEEKKVKKIIATSDMILNRTTSLIPIPLRVNTYDEALDEIVEEDWIFKAKRLSDKDSTSLINWEIHDKEVKEIPLTPEERAESLSYKRKVLAKCIKSPEFTEKQWYEDVDNAIILNLFAKAQHILLSVDDSALYEDFFPKSRVAPPYKK